MCRIPAERATVSKRLNTTVVPYDRTVNLTFTPNIHRHGALALRSKMQETEAKLDICCLEVKLQSEARANGGLQGVETMQKWIRKGQCSPETKDY
ncbi:uncharacterized [Tachysurus ichikawai]